MTSKRINLALQGGGAHGAFTWGVLDRLLDEPKLEIAAISGASAGALNGAVLKAGLATGGRVGAQQNLDWLWSQMGALQNDAAAQFFSFFTPPAKVVSQMLEASPFFGAVDAVARLTSPYSAGALYENPLAALVGDLHFDEICAPDGPAFNICATNVRSGKIKVFKGDEISRDAILASACLPTLFQAVEINGEHYWDGGYTGNPALFPLFEAALPSDIVIVNINPLERERLPQTPLEIQNRINEISFNSSLLRELRAIGFVKRLLRQQMVMPGTMKDINVHMIADDEMMGKLSVATKIMPVPSVLWELKRAGQAAADGFLTDHWDKLGVESSVDLEAMLG